MIPDSEQAPTSAPTAAPPPATRARRRLTLALALPVLLLAIDISVMGVAPVDDPQYVVSVNLGYPTTITSSAAAAPLFHTIMSQVLKTYRVKPSTSSPADYPPYY